jgi:hypothetical protein
MMTNKSQLKPLIPDMSTHMKRASDEQKSIGWEQWFCRQNNNTWGGLVQLFHQKLKPVDKIPIY